MKSSLMARMPKGNPGGHHDWVSRDYADIDCYATGCLFNRNKKCGAPSLCEIGDDGKCEGFTVKPLLSGSDGD